MHCGNPPNSFAKRDDQDPPFRVEENERLGNSPKVAQVGGGETSWEPALHTQARQPQPGLMGNPHHRRGKEPPMETEN